MSYLWPGRPGPSVGGDAFETRCRRHTTSPNSLACVRTVPMEEHKDYESGAGPAAASLERPALGTLGRDRVPLAAWTGAGSPSGHGAPAALDDALYRPAPRSAVSLPDHVPACRPAGDGQAFITSRARAGLSPAEAAGWPAGRVVALVIGQPLRPRACTGRAAAGEDYRWPQGRRGSSTPAGSARPAESRRDQIQQQPRPSVAGPRSPRAVQCSGPASRSMDCGSHRVRPRECGHSAVCRASPQRLFVHSSSSIADAGRASPPLVSGRPGAACACGYSSTAPGDP